MDIEYERDQCPECKKYIYVGVEKGINKQYHNNKLWYVESYAEVNDVISEKYMVKRVLSTIVYHLYNGITIHELCRILNEAYGIAKKDCCAFINLIKDDLFMYSPDMYHLCFVDNEAEQQIKGIQ